MGGRCQREGTYIYLQLIHIYVWQQPTQYCKATILQLKINKFKLKIHKINSMLVTDKCYRKKLERTEEWGFPRDQI